MRKLMFISLVVGLAVVLAACGSSPAPAESSSAAQANVTFETNPNPAAKGDVEIIFTVTNADGGPIEGAKVDVSAEHPAMAGMGMSGQATEQGGGKYSIKANFSDAGDWKLTVYVRKDGLDYKQEFDLPIQ
ncbi:MAG: FixH family protein [Chloroflexi bacterium]|nr:FixH family protein [Chloroflexota bacterium]